MHYRAFAGGVATAMIVALSTLSIVAQQAQTSTVPPTAGTLRMGQSAGADPSTRTCRVPPTKSSRPGEVVLPRN